MSKRLSKKQLEKMFNCDIFKDFGFDNSQKYWVALGYEGSRFDYADGWTLRDLKIAIERAITNKELEG